MKHHHTVILNQFPALRRKRLIRWLHLSPRGKKLYHQSFLTCIQALFQKGGEAYPDQRTMIAYSLLHEFGIQVSNPGAYQHLISAVAKRLNQ